MTTTEGVLEWARGAQEMDDYPADQEAAARIAENERLRQAFENEYCDDEQCGKYMHERLSAAIKGAEP
jgi:hypothetical protein